MTKQEYTRVADGVYQRAPRQYLARTWRGGPTRTFDSKREAVAWRRDTMSKRDKGNPVVLVARNKSTVAQECAHWLHENRRYLSESTFITYRSRIDNAINHAKYGIGSIRLTDLTPQRIEQWIHDQEGDGYKPRTINSARTVLGEVLKSAVQRGRLGDNPTTRARALPLPKSRLIVAPDPADVAAITNALPHNLRIVATLALGAGLRLGEALGLMPGDVDRENLAIHVERQWGPSSGRHKFSPPKYGRDRRVPVQPSLIDALDAHERIYGVSTAGTYVSGSRSGAPVLHAVWSDAWESARRRTGVKLSGVHQLRHAYGSYAVAEGENIANVSAWMGHENIETTMRYYLHAMPNARPTFDPLATVAVREPATRETRTNRTLRAV